MSWRYYTRPINCGTGVAHYRFDSKSKTYEVLIFANHHLIKYERLIARPSRQLRGNGVTYISDGLFDKLCTMVSRFGADADGESLYNTLRHQGVIS